MTVVDRVVIDPPDSPATALRGRVVTMDADRSVHEDAVVYSRAGRIAAVLDPAADPPEGFAGVSVTATGGTIYPGLIELHNHLPYDVLSLWQVPERYHNRGEWGDAAGYHTNVSRPMSVLGRDPALVAAIVRFVEVRCLLAGTTTSQGVALAASSGIISKFRGLVRNVESTGEVDLPPAVTHIADVDARDGEKFLKRISGHSKMLLHLSEGVDDEAREHFLALKLSADRWAITPNLIGIHCAGLKQEDFRVLKAHGGSMVWSPLSNLLLYGQTADLGAALAEGVQVALGSDWAPSGSKSLLSELKMARIAAPGAGAPQLSGADLVAMATCNPAQMLGWGTALGSLEAGKHADVIVIAGTGSDPYDTLIDATEADIQLVMINGVPRVGVSRLMSRLGVTGGERYKVGRVARTLNLSQSTADQTVESVTVKEALSRLRAALKHLPDAPRSDRLGLAEPADGLMLAVAGVVDNHMARGPRLPYRGRPTGPGPSEPVLGATPPPMVALELPPLTAVDDPGYYPALEQEPNLPQDVRDAIHLLAS